MRAIEVSKNSKRGKKAITWVDDGVYDKLNEYKWCIMGSGYVGRVERVDGVRRTILMHREILSVEGFSTDHIDRDKLNNQRYNLRIATTAQNLYNQKKTKAITSSKYKGVTRVYGRSKGWMAYISPNYKFVYLGMYDTEEEAGRAYNDKATELWGDRASLNVIDNIKK